MLYCPLCAHGVEPYSEDRRRAYFRCPRCDLVSADPQSHLDAPAEWGYYDLHENDPADQGCRRFLGRLAGPILGRLNLGMRGLDYGCGPGADPLGHARGGRDGHGRLRPVLPAESSGVGVLL